MDPRHWLLKTLFAWSERPYAAMCKSRAPWGLSAATLRGYPAGTLGRVLGHYLGDQGFELLPKLESHDICHLLTAVPTDVPSEVALQYLLLGNGKRSLYLLGVVVLGAVVLPEHLGAFVDAFRRGRHMERFHDWDFRAMLDQPFRAVGLHADAALLDDALVDAVGP